MHAKTFETQKATAGTAMAPSQNHQGGVYPNRDTVSTSHHLERAAQPKFNLKKVTS